jgi:peptide deformylase
MLTLRYWEDPVLSKVCDPVRDSEFGSKLEEFGRELLATMDNYRGLGLAAPQVGVTFRMFIMRFPDNTSLNPIVVCNPTLHLHGPATYLQEGCLSVPDIFEQVSRSQFATLRFFHPDGTEDEIELSNVNARVAQHETDHLDGIMFFDRRRVSKQVSKAVQRAWEKHRKQLGL